MCILTACTAGFLLDQLLGDPAWIYHPIRMIGYLISWLEKKLYREGGSARTLRRRGTMLWVLTVGISTTVPCLLLFVASRIHPVCTWMLETFWCWQLLAARSLKAESLKVQEALTYGTLDDGRRAVSMIVGRDTGHLTEEGVVKAAVETVAENTSDGVIAPLFYLMIGGAGLGFFYKAVNTMDSMIGYRNDRYLDFGRTAARMDDLCNLIPSTDFRDSDDGGGRNMLGMSDRAHYSLQNAWRIYRRDRHNHKSPNAAQTEAVCAGALMVRLAGNAWYFGKLYEKPSIGDAIRSVEREDIQRACHLLMGTSWLGLLFFWQAGEVVVPMVRQKESEVNDMQEHGGDIYTNDGIVRFFCKYQSSGAGRKGYEGIAGEHFESDGLSGSSLQKTAGVGGKTGVGSS